MLSWLLSKNNTRTTTYDELIETIITNKDLFFRQGITTINGIKLYHFVSESEEAQLSYGSCVLKIKLLHDPIYKMQIGLCTFGRSSHGLECYVTTEGVQISSKTDNDYHDVIPFTAFDSEIDFFQYTLLNLKYSCTDAALVKLIKFILEIKNVNTEHTI